MQTWSTLSILSPRFRLPRSDKGSPVQSSDCNPHERWALEHSSETMAQPEDANNGFYRRLGKRLIDIVASLVGLVLLSPVLIAVSILVKCTSPGPILYWQDRVGRGEKMFRIAKFRSMVAGADKKGPSITSSGDARVTRLGAILRKFKLDEFPQLWNVLRGEMSLVGPRPELPFDPLSTRRRTSWPKPKPGGVLSKRCPTAKARIEPAVYQAVISVLRRKIDLFNAEVSLPIASNTNQKICDMYCNEHGF